MLATAIARKNAIGGLYARQSCAMEKLDEAYDLLFQQLKNGVKMMKLELSSSVKEQNGLSEKTKSLSPQTHKTEEVFVQRTRRFNGAVGAFGTAAGLILGDPNEDVACTALNILKICNDNSQLSRHIEATMEIQQQTILVLQCAQAKKDDIFFLLSIEVKETQKM